MEAVANRYHTKEIQLVAAAKNNRKKADWVTGLASTLGWKHPGKVRKVPQVYSLVRGQIYWLVARKRSLGFFQKQYGVLRGRRELCEEALRLDMSVLTTPVTGNISSGSFSPGVLWGSGFVCVIFPPLLAGRQ